MEKKGNELLRSDRKRIWCFMYRISYFFMFFFFRTTHCEFLGVLVSN